MSDEQVLTMPDPNTACKAGFIYIHSFLHGPGASHCFGKKKLQFLSRASLCVPESKTSNINTAQRGVNNQGFLLMFHSEGLSLPACVPVCIGIVPEKE